MRSRKGRRPIEIQCQGYPIKTSFTRCKLFKNTTTIFLTIPKSASSQSFVTSPDVMKMITHTHTWNITLVEDNGDGKLQIYSAFLYSTYAGNNYVSSDTLVRRVKNVIFLTV